MKKLLSLALVTGLILSSAFSKSKTTFKANKAVKDTGSIAISDISATEVTKLMGTGWNLGNTLDATNGKGLNSETSWGQPKTTKKMIEGLAKSGIKTIRIPTSWANHIIDTDYTIDPAWMARVKEIVDWAISEDMYVILNTHHDNYPTPTGLTAGKGYYPTESNYEDSEKFFVNVWSQIALAFNNGYDQHLIFETMNEPRLRGTNDEWSFRTSNKQQKNAMDIINKLNQASLNAIRQSGGNNSKRFVLVPGYAATPECVLSDAFVLPEDTAKNKLLVSVHMYTPYHFAMQSPGTVNYSAAMGAELYNTFQRLNKKFVSNGVGVIIGEYGATNKNNLEERVKWFSTYIKHSQTHNLVAVLWDNGDWKVKEGTKDYNEKYGFYNRQECKWYFPEIHQAILSELK